MNVVITLHKVDKFKCLVKKLNKIFLPYNDNKIIIGMWQNKYYILKRIFFYFVNGTLTSYLKIGIYRYKNITNKFSPFYLNL